MKEKVRCPYCGKVNKDVMDGRENRPQRFEQNCSHCKRKVLYEVRMVPKIIALKEGLG